MIMSFKYKKIKLNKKKNKIIFKIKPYLKKF